MIMRKLPLIVFLLSCMSYAQVGIQTTDPQGVLDVESTTEGILIPRVALVETTQQAPVLNPRGGNLANGTLVYNTARVNDVFPGFYYWKDIRWQPLISDGQILNFTSVTLPSPSGTNNNADFLLGTTNYFFNVFRIVHSGAELGGIIDGQHGRIIYIYNESNTDLKILAEDNSASAPANRFSADGDIIIKPGNTLIVVYDAIYANRWSVVRSDN